MPPDAVQYEPSGLLRNPDVPLQLHAGHALEAGHFQVDGEDPLPKLDFVQSPAKTDLGPLQSRPDPHRERLLASPAVVGPVGRSGRFLGVRATAPRAVKSVEPHQGLELRIPVRIPWTLQPSMSTQSQCTIPRGSDLVPCPLDGHPWQRSRWWSPPLLPGSDANRCRARTGFSP